MKVSVVIPNYNHARFLPVRIESVLRQTFQEFDVLILDDASTDDSPSVIAGYVGDRVRFLPNERNSGSTFAQWNKGISETAGEYVWIAESDDEADPRFLERLVNALDRHPSTSFAFCQASLIDEDSHVFGLALAQTTVGGKPSRYATDFVVGGIEELRRYLQWQMAPVPNASAALFRRRSLVAAGPADASYRVGGDFQLYTRLLQVGDVGFVAEALCRYRHHRRSVRAATARDATHAWERYRLARELLPLIPLDSAELLSVYRKLADYWIVAAIQNRSTTSLARHRQIWAVARQVDRHLGRHLAGAFSRHVWSSLRRRAAGTSAP